MASSTVLYIIEEKNSSDGFYKIGITKDMTRRLSDHQTGNPRILSVTKIYHFTSMLYAQTLEKALLQKLESKEFIDYKRSEWFKVNDLNQFIEYIDETVAVLIDLIEQFHLYIQRL